jgi:hypothetical protein
MLYKGALRSAPFVFSGPKPIDLMRACAQAWKACSTPVWLHFCGGRGVRVKKAKGKGKATGKTEAAKKDTSTTKKSTDLEEVRENINELVKASAELIATSVIGVALRTGQLASARYLFEAVGLYPANEQTERPIETTMAHQLLTRMGIPLEPVVYDEDAEPDAGSDAQAASTQAADTADEDPAEDGGGENSLPAEDEE